jgi:hypothetical protein
MGIEAALQESLNARETLAKIKKYGLLRCPYANGSDDRRYALPESAFVFEEQEDDQNQPRRNDNQRQK